MDDRSIFSPDLCGYYYAHASAWDGLQLYYSTGCPKKMGFSGKIAITTLKHIQNANVGGVLENSGNLLHYGYLDFQNGRRND